MADLVTRIILEDKQFNNKIEASKKTVRGFGDEAGKAGQSVDGMGGKIGSLASGALTKLIGGLGAAATAGAAFKKIIDSSQTSADGFQAILGGATTTVDQFFKSISTGDFSNFVNGLGDVYRRAKEAQIALDQLWNTQQAYGLLSSEEQFKLTTARADANDRDLSPEERKKALENWKSSITTMRGYAETYKTDVLQTAKSIVATYNTLAVDSFGYEDLRDVVKLDLTNPAKRDEVKDAVFAEYKAYTEAVKQAQKDAEYTYTKHTTAGGRTTSNKAKGFKQGQFDADLKRLNEQYKGAILTHSLLEKARDEGEDQLSGIIDKLKEYVSIDQQVATLDLTFNRAKERLGNQIEKDLKGEDGGKSGVKIKAEIIPSGSLTELEKQIQEARKSFLNATTDEARAAADILIKDLEARKAIVSIQFKYADMEDVGIGNNKATVKGIDYKAFKDVDMSGVKQGIGDVKTWNELMSDMADKNRDTIDSLNAVGGAIGNIGSALDNEAGAWLQWGANVVSSIGQAIPAIAALTTAKSAEATANTASAASGAASSVASIPVVGPVMAVAAIASIVAALASVPKFAYGGIVPGNSFSGDNVLARVNSGEMILPTGLQSNLFNMIKVGGSARGGNGEIGGNVTFEIEGKKLVGVLNNQNTRQNRG